VKRSPRLILGVPISWAVVVVMIGFALISLNFGNPFAALCMVVAVPFLIRILEGKDVS